jgi:hypothetical protein
VDEAIAKLDGLKNFDPQAAVEMIRMCVIPSLTYLAQVTPPELTLTEFERFDQQVASTVMHLLTPTQAPKGSNCLHR